MKLRYYIRGLGIGIAVTAVIMSGISHSNTEKLSDEQIIERAKELGLEEKKTANDSADAISETENIDKIAMDAGVSTTIMQQNQGQEKQEQQNQEEINQEEINQEEINHEEINQEEKNQEEINQEEQNQEQGNRTQEETGNVVGSDRKNESEEQLSDERMNETSIETTSEQPDKTTDTSREENSDAAAEQPAKDMPTTDGNQAEATEAAVQTNENQIAQTPETITVTVNSGDGSQVVAKKMQEAGLIEDAKAYDDFLCRYGYDRRLCTGNHVFTKGDSDEQMAQNLMTRLN